MSTPYTAWIILFCIVSVAEMGYATSRSSLAVTGVKSTRALKALSCNPMTACSWARTNSAKFINYLQTTTDDVCTCTCPSNQDRLAHDAAESSSFQSVIALERLKFKGCDLDIKNGNMNTPLHDACEHCNVPQAAYLVNSGADFMSLNNDGWSPLCLCAANCSSKAEDLVKNMINRMTSGGSKTCVMCQSGKSASATAKDPKIKEVIAKGTGC